MEAFRAKSRAPPQNAEMVEQLRQAVVGEAGQRCNVSKLPQAFTAEAEENVCDESGGAVLRLECALLHVYERQPTPTPRRIEGTCECFTFAPSCRKKPSRGKRVNVRPSLWAHLLSLIDRVVAETRKVAGHEGYLNDVVL